MFEIQEKMCVAFAHQVTAAAIKCRVGEGAPSTPISLNVQLLHVSTCACLPVDVAPRTRGVSAYALCRRSCMRLCWFHLTRNAHARLRVLGQWHRR
jgi:hypothetical protein